MTRPLLCFDLGRVLVRICDDWAHAHAVAGLEGDAPDATRSELKDVLSAQVHAFEVGAISVDAFVAEAARLLDRPVSDVRRIVDVWVRGATPGAIALLDELAARGHRIACLSNTNLRHWTLMSGWQGQDAIFSRLQLRLASHELGVRKPDAAIYAALEQQGGARPHDIVFFDDLPDNIAAASARGWRAIEVRSREDPVAEMRAWLREAGLL